MKYFGILLSFLVPLAAISQYGEEVGPLTGNPKLLGKSIQNATNAKSDLTYDSTFIYISDTLQLPIFDDFSTNKFQEYGANFNDPGVTSILEYQLLNLASQPLAANYIGTQQVTFRRLYIVQAGTFTDTPFVPEEVQNGDLSEYPASYQTIDVYPPYYIYDTITTVGGTDPSPDTVWITGPEIVQDSARQFFAPVNNQNAIWLDKEVYLNNSMAWNPWSIGVATFDGLDEKGYPYAINTTNTNYADHLTSKPIDMSTMTPADSVYFTFMFQAQGLADPPEQGDSLILQFYSSTLDDWNNVWSTNGVALDTFRVGHILIDNPDYLTDAFQFRFKNFGGLSGSLDHWHVDYVNLRSVPGFGGSADTFARDIAFSYPIHTLLEDYTSVPWDHYKNLANPNDAMSSQVNITMANSFPTEIGANDGSMTVNYGGAFEGSILLVSDILCDNVNDNYFRLDLPSSAHDIKSSYTFDQSKSGLSQEFEVIAEATGGATNFTGNDSTIFKQEFKNYYSYDDGSAEAAYGPTGVQSRLAIQYTPYEADSLIGAMIHFVPSVFDVSNNLFVLTVWDDDNGEPGNVIYEDNPFLSRTPEYNYGYNMFTYYYFEDTSKIHVDGTFYIGWRQLEADRLNVGLDRNIINNDHTFFSVDGGSTWESSTIEGSVMIRPIFSTGLDITLGLESIQPEKVSQVYPNPTRDQVTIVPAGEFTSAVLRNMQGQIILKTSQTQFTMEGLPSGIYFLEIAGERKVHKISKL